MKSLRDVKVGDTVWRFFGGFVIPQAQRVTAVTDARIICGAWEFDRENGGEIDPSLGLPPGIVASYIRPRDDDQDFSVAE
jgi:hypothetical protein